jgi:hypothetical protein
MRTHHEVVLSAEGCVLPACRWRRFRAPQQSNNGFSGDWKVHRTGRLEYLVSVAQVSNLQAQRRAMACRLEVGDTAG